MVVNKDQLYNKYRPQSFDDVVEQDSIKKILKNQIDNRDIKSGYLFCGPAGDGKCLAKDTPILMYDGTIKLVQDIKIGDQLMGPDSKPRNVLSLARGQETMYKVIPARGGITWGCNESHILSLKCNCTRKRGKKYVKDKIFNLSIKDYLTIGKSTKKLLRLYRTSIDFPNCQCLDIDPYIYGLWLGDGTSGKAELSSTDKEIVDAWCTYGQSLGMILHVYDKDRCPRYTFTNGNIGGKPNKLKQFFDMSLIEGHKRILHEYKIASKEDRLKLLAGIIDTDGYKLSNRNSIEITTKYQDLAEDYAFVARSLGFRVCISSRNFTFKDKPYCKYVVRIAGDLKSIPCKLQRKVSTRDFKDGDPLKTSFKLENIGLGDYYGFTIDGDHLFVLGDFTVTHNTTCARIFAKEINGGVDSYFEMDAASNSSVEDVKVIRAEARLASIDAEYKIFIIDECHSLSAKAWDPFLKILEEAPKGTIFIFCTTEPRKVNTAILSRLQRFDFKRISFNGILNRLKYIIEKENTPENPITYTQGALDYIAKLAEGGMREAIKSLDQCLSYTRDLTYESVCSSLNVISYDVLFDLLDMILHQRESDLVKLINEIYMKGVDLKLFINEYISFLLDIHVYHLTRNPELIKIPQDYNDRLQALMTIDLNKLKLLLYDISKLKAEIKFEDKPKFSILVCLIKECEKVNS